ncbi:MAG: amino acid synthesis family protein [Pseudomonadota bacterium]
MEGQAVAGLTAPPLSYGKAAMFGIAGVMEHRGVVVPSHVKTGAAGMTIDLPLGHVDSPWSSDHFDTMTLWVADAPLADETVICLAYADGARPIPRCGTGPMKSGYTKEAL